MRGLAIILFLAVPLVAQTGLESPSAPNPKLPVARRHAPIRGVAAGPAQQVSLAENRLRDAATAGNLEATEAILASDYTITLPDGHVLDKQHLIGALRSGVLSGASLEVSDVRVRTLGPMAAAVTAQVEMKQKGRRRAFRLINVWSKQDEGWKLIRSQTTEIKPRR